MFIGRVLEYSLQDRRRDVFEEVMDFVADLDDLLVEVITAAQDSVLICDIFHELENWRHVVGILASPVDQTCHQAVPLGREEYFYKRHDPESQGFADSQL